MTRMSLRPRGFRLGAAVVVVAMTGLIGAPSVRAQDDPGARHRVPAEFMSFRGADWLERAERATEEQPDRVIAALDLQPGDVVADVGCGTGYYARRILQHVQPGGRVYCEDIQPEMLELMLDRAAADGITTGLEPILGTPVDPALPAGEVDWVIIADVYHEMSDPEPMLAGIRRSLAPGGRVALLEYRVEDGTGDGIKADHSMSVRQVLQEWRPAGFELVALHDFLPTQHLFVFRSAGDASAPALADLDLLEAVDEGLVEIDPRGDGAEAVVVRIRRTGTDPLVVTAPVGTVFRSEGASRDMLARRDGWVVLDDDEWRDWRVRAVGRQPDRAPPTASARLTARRPSPDGLATEVLHRAQVGTYTVADSPTLYIPPVHAIEQAALWIAEADLAYDEVVDRVSDDRMPAPYVVAFGLVLADGAGVDVRTRRVWADHERVFGRLRDQGLRVWHQLQTAR